jgi:hypothetical protein
MVRALDLIWGPTDLYSKSMKTLASRCQMPILTVESNSTQKNTSEYVLAETLSLIFMRVLARRKSNIDNNGVNVTT